MRGRPEWATAGQGRSADNSLLVALAGLSSEVLSPLLESMFAACEAQFLELAVKAAGTHEELGLLEFRRELARKRATVTRDFVARVTDALCRLQQRESPDQSTGADKLELVSQEQIEKQLLVSGGVSRVRNEWRVPLSQLHERMLAIAPNEFSAQDNPLDPGRIAQAFLEACHQIEADMKCLRLLCKQFDAHVLGHLDAFYRSSNQVLIDARVLPYLAAAPERHAPARTTEPAASERAALETGREQPVAVRFGPGADGPYAPVAGGIATGGTGCDAREAGGLLGEIAGLLHRARGGAAPLALATRLPGSGAIGVAPGWGAAAPAPARAVGVAASVDRQLSAPQLAALLRDLQGEYGWLDAGSRPPADIRGAIGTIAARRGELGLGAAEGDVLDIVTMLFDTIADDPNLPAEIQVLISRLQLPVLRIALLDRGFFGDRGHPARQFINAIARAGRGWDAHDRQGQDSLRDEIGSLVDELARNPGAAAGEFGEALEKLNAGIERAELRAVKLERRTSEKAVAEARLVAARDAVHAAMKERLEGHDLPVPVLEFFAADWQRVLQLFYLRKGTDSAEWKDAVRMLDDLARSVVRPADAVARGALARSLPELYQRLENALAQTQSHTEEARARVDVIREVHRELLAASAAGVVAQLVPIERARIEPPPMVPPRGPAPAAAARAEPAVEPPPGVLTIESLQRVDEIPIGTWFGYEEGKSGTPRRCKLSARIDETRMFLFCDRHGMLVREMPRKAFAYALQSGEWRVIEDSPLVERTMERIAGSLRQQAGAA